MDEEAFSFEDIHQEKTNEDISLYEHTRSKEIFLPNFPDTSTNNVGKLIALSHRFNVFAFTQKKCIQVIQSTALHQVIDSNEDVLPTTNQLLFDKYLICKIITGEQPLYIELVEAFLFVCFENHFHVYDLKKEIKCGPCFVSDMQIKGCVISIDYFENRIIVVTKEIGRGSEISTKKLKSYLLRADFGERCLIVQKELSFQDYATVSMWEKYSCCFCYNLTLFFLNPIGKQSFKKTFDGIGFKRILLCKWVTKENILLECLVTRLQETNDGIKTENIREWFVFNVDTSSLTSLGECLFPDRRERERILEVFFLEHYHFGMIISNNTSGDCIQFFEVYKNDFRIVSILEGKNIFLCSKGRDSCCNGAVFDSSYNKELLNNFTKETHPVSPLLILVDNNGKLTITSVLKSSMKNDYPITKKDEIKVHNNFSFEEELKGNTEYQEFLQRIDQKIVDLLSVRKEYVCFITKKMYLDPVFVDGYNYERRAMEERYKKRNFYHPHTKARIDQRFVENLKTNFDKKSCIETYKAKCAKKIKKFVPICLKNFRDSGSDKELWRLLCKQLFERSSQFGRTQEDPILVECALFTLRKVEKLKYIDRFLNIPPSDEKVKDCVSIILEIQKEFKEDIFTTEMLIKAKKLLKENTVELEMKLSEELANMNKFEKSLEILEGIDKDKHTKDTLKKLLRSQRTYLGFVETKYLKRLNDVLIEEKKYEELYEHTLSVWIEDDLEYLKEIKRIQKVLIKNEKKDFAIDFSRKLVKLFGKAPVIERLDILDELYKLTPNDNELLKNLYNSYKGLYLRKNVLSTMNESDDDDDRSGKNDIDFS